LLKLLQPVVENTKLGMNA